MCRAKRLVRDRFDKDGASGVLMDIRDGDLWADAAGEEQAQTSNQQVATRDRYV
jgi:hypothetical protein